MVNEKVFILYTRLYVNKLECFEVEGGMVGLAEVSRLALMGFPQIPQICADCYFDNFEK